jgi:amino acid adenylation domain-containing protein
MDKKVIHSVFEDVARRDPLKVAIESTDGDISYGDLNRYANRLSHILGSVGAKTGTIVNVAIPSSTGLVSTLLAVFKSGGIFLPLDLAFSMKLLTQIFKNTFDGIVIVTADTMESVIHLLRELDIKASYIIVAGNDGRIVLYRYSEGDLTPESLEEEPEWVLDGPLKINGDSSSYIYYTSGTTGEGKAILGAHVSLSHFIHWEIKEFAVDETFRISQLTQVTFDASLRDIFVALISGGTLCIPSGDIKNNPARLLNWLDQSRISLVHCVPSLFRILVKELQTTDSFSCDLSQLKYILMAGEILYAKDIAIWRRIIGDKVRVINLYGATETTLIKTFYRIGAISENPTQIIPVGIPISNTSVAIVKEEGICKTGEIGEIYIKTPFMSKGYYKNEKLTAECFVYKTGDLGRYLPDGNIEVLGRLDSQVKVNGIRVELAEVEQALLKQENITAAVVKTHRTDDNLITLVAYYTGEKMDDSLLRDLLAKELNQQLIPPYFIHLEEFPLNLNGKIDKKALPLPEDVMMGDIYFEPPADDVEIRLATLWMEILGLKKIGRNISFFSVGGHSLRAIQLVSRIQKEFGADLKIADIFTHRTIRDLADFILNFSKKEHASISPVTQQLHYPLSSSQRRLWVLSQFEEGNIAYNVQGVFVFEGYLDVESMEYAFAELIARHEILRTVFKEDNEGQIRQYILSRGEVKHQLSGEDLTGVSEQDAQLNTLLGREFARPFNLSSAPLFRAKLFQLTDSKWIFTYTLHHIISDAWSMGVLIRELLTLYNAYIGGEPNPLPPLRIQYKDYAAWQQKRLGEEELESVKQYWVSQFEGDLPILDFPGDRPRPTIRSNKGGAIVKILNSRLYQGIKSLSEDQGGTLFMGLLTLVNAILYRYTNQKDIIIGSPIAGREHIDLEDQIGFYVNTLALRTRFNGSNNFKELLEIVKNVTIGAYRHQEYPFDELVNELHLQRDMSRNPLFDVMLVLENKPNIGIENGQYLSGLKIYGYNGEHNQFSKFDFQFNFSHSIACTSGMYSQKSPQYCLASCLPVLPASL